MKRVLITGAAGLIGQVLQRELSQSYDVVAVDRRRRAKGVAHADMTRESHASRSMQGVDVVIDLASAHWQKPWDVVLRNNIPAVWMTLEAARRHGVRRVIYASSNHVTGLYEQDAPFANIVAGNYAGLDPARVPRITTDMPIRPDTPYGVGKALGEAAARYFAEACGLSVLCLRVGSLNYASRPSTARHFATLITHADMARLTRCSIEAPPELSFGVYYGVSYNTWRIWDFEDATQAIGYEPKDNAEYWRHALDGDHRSSEHRSSYRAS